MRCWLTLPTTTSVRSGAHTFTSSMRVHTMRMTATHGLQVFRGPTPRRVPQLQVVCSIMQTTTMQTQRSRMVPVSLPPTHHRPRLTCVSILTQSTAVPTVAVELTLPICQLTAMMGPSTGQHGKRIELDFTTMVLVLALLRVNFKLVPMSATKSPLQKPTTTTPMQTAIGLFQFG